MLSDARSEMKYARIQKQKMKTWPSVNQKDRFTLIALNSTCRSQVYENSRREQIMLHAELDNRERERERERALQETRIGTLQELEAAKNLLYWS